MSDSEITAAQEQMHANSGLAYGKAVTTHGKGRYWTRASKEERYQRAKDAGLSDALARQYAESFYSEDTDSDWDNFVKNLGGKGSRQLSLETNESADAELLRSLLDKQHTEDYTDPAAETSRRSAAGINDALTAGSEIGSGETSDSVAETENVASLNSAINSEAAERPMKVASSLMSSLGGIMNMINGGVDLSRAIYDLNINEANDVFNTIGRMNDLGNFFPFLGIQYNPSLNGFTDVDDSDVQLDLQRVYGMNESTFMHLMRKNSPIRDRRVLKNLYRSYKSMATPEGVNAYMSRYRDNLKLQNESFDESAAGVGRTGSFTKATRDETGKPFIDPDYMTGSKFNTNFDQSTVDFVVQTASDLYQYGLQAVMSTNKNEFTENLINQKVFESVSSVVNRLSADATIKHDPLAEYLLVNMMSGSFNGIGEASMVSNPGDFSSPKAAFNTLAGWSTMSFGAALKGLQNFGMPFLLKNTPSQSYIHSFKH